MFGRNGNKRDTLIGGLEPNDLGAVNGAPRFIATITLAFATFSFLFLLRGSGGRTQETQGAGKQLAGHSLHNGHNVTSELRLNFVGNSKGKWSEEA